IDRLRRDLHSSAVALSTSARVIDEIRSSTIWASLEPVRLLGNKLPVSIRQSVRGTLKYVRRIGRRSVPGGQDVLHAGEPVESPAASDPAVAARAPINSYDEWVSRFDTLLDSDRDDIRSDIKRSADRPKISIVMPVYETPEWTLRAAIDSVLQ